MKKFVSTLLILTLNLPTLAAAQTPTSQPEKTTASTPSPDSPAPPKTFLSPDDPGMISPLLKDQKAPFPGILFSPRAAASMSTDISTMKDKVKIEVDAAVHTAEAKKDFLYNELKIQCVSDRSRLEANIDANQKKIQILEADLKKAIDATPSRSTWFGIGAASGIVFTLATAFAVSRLTK